MSQKIDTRIQFSGLKPGRYTYHYALDNAFFEQFENDEIRGAAVECEVEMERLEQTLLFATKLQGQIEVLCDRCLGPMSVEVEGEERLCVKFSDSEQTDADDVAILPTDSFEIDLAQWLYEYVAVRIPMQHTHPDGECDPETVRYLEQKAPQPDDQPIDPRWEALLKLKK